jgi:hypothetical protein
MQDGTLELAFEWDTHDLPPHAPTGSVGLLQTGLETHFYSDLEMIDIPGVTNLEVEVW